MVYWKPIRRPGSHIELLYLLIILSSNPTDQITSNQHIHLRLSTTADDKLEGMIQYLLMMDTRARVGPQ
jgi:hypothetical protein